MFPKILKTDAVRALFVGGSDVTLGEAIEAFLRVELIGRSEQTKVWYRRCLLPMARILGINRSLAELMELDIVAWYEQIAGRKVRYCGGLSRPETEGGLTKESLRGYVRAARRFFRWLYKKGILQADLSADLCPPSKPKRGKKGISDDDAAAILLASETDPRDYALLRFMETAGVRRGGVANLLLSDLDLNAPSEKLRRRVTVREKGDKERVVFLTSGGLDALISWLKVRPKIDDPHVFLGRKSGQGWRPLTEGGISAILRRYKERLELAGRVSPHQWRHRFCRKRMQEGMNLKQVSQLAGHESIVVTAEYYGEFGIDDLQDAYDDHVKD